MSLCGKPLLFYNKFMPGKAHLNISYRRDCIVDLRGKLDVCVVFVFLGLKRSIYLFGSELQLLSLTTVYLVLLS